MRWTQTALVAWSCLALLGCFGAAQAGLSNAPALGAPGEPGAPPDVISNGRDACRNRQGAPGCWPPCEKVTEVPLERALIAQSATPAVAGLCEQR
jgi:hypothetical protein